MRHFYLFFILIVIAFSCEHKKTPVEVASEVNKEVQSLIDSVNTDCSALELYLSRCKVMDSADSLISTREKQFTGKKLQQFKDSIIELDANPSYQALIHLTEEKNERALKAFPYDVWMINESTFDVRSICKFNKRKNRIFMYNFYGEIELEKWDDAYNSKTDEAGYYNRKIFFDTKDNEYTITTWDVDSMVSITFKEADETDLQLGTYYCSNLPELAIQLLPDNMAVVGDEKGTYHIESSDYSNDHFRFRYKILQLEMNDGRAYRLLSLTHGNGKQPRGDDYYDVWSVFDFGNQNEWWRVFESTPDNILCLFGLDEAQKQQSATISMNSTDSTGSGWDEVLDEYEQFVDSYVAIYKKAMNGDMSALTEYAAYLEKAQSVSEKLSSAEDDLTPAQLNRYMQITQKMTQILEK